MVGAMRERPWRGAARSLFALITGCAAHSKKALCILPAQSLCFSYQFSCQLSSGSNILSERTSEYLPGTVPVFPGFLSFMPSSYVRFQRTGADHILCVLLKKRRDPVLNPVEAGFEQVLSGLLHGDGICQQGKHLTVLAGFLFSRAVSAG